MTLHFVSRYACTRRQFRSNCRLKRILNLYTLFLSFSIAAGSHQSPGTIVIITETKILITDLFEICEGALLTQVVDVRIFVLIFVSLTMLRPPQRGWIAPRAKAQIIVLLLLQLLLLEARER